MGAAVYRVDGPAGGKKQAIDVVSWAETSREGDVVRAIGRDAVSGRWSEEQPGTQWRR